MQNWQFISDGKNINKNINNLQKIIGELPRPLVFTNGVFDILHLGHIKYLRNSKSFGSSLIVGINSNESTKQLGKGIDRPINDEIDRAEIISSLKPVDLCVIFNELTPENLIKEVNPEIYTKGNDYNKETIPFMNTLENLRIKTFFIPMIKNKSSSKIIQRIKEKAFL